jgi:hypothetical protein
MKEDIEGIIAKQIKSEFDTENANQGQDNADFEAIIDLLECKRTEKNYDWMSDNFYPEYPAIILTESSQWASQYFSSREYVDVYLEGDGENDKEKCKLVKKLINKTLNRIGLYHYNKYMRARTINSTAGYVYAICGWEQVLQETVTGYKRVPTGEIQVLENGLYNPIFKNEEIKEDIPLKDHFEYDVIDPRNVATSNNYCYSVQEKEWVSFRSEESYETLKSNEKSHGYINLDKIKEILKKSSINETETSKESYNKDAQASKPSKPVIKVGDVITRYGKMWAVVINRDEVGNPTKVEYGYDELGIIKDKAELVECISTVFIYGSNPILIRFQPTPFIDSIGNPYKPIIRGLCYIHPTKDTGMSDGKYSRELQVAINDTINISNDRVKLATLPTFIGDKYACEDNDQIYMEPEHIIPMEGGTDKLKELQIRDNIGGAMQQTNLLIQGLHNVNAVFPPQMGDTGLASTTATAIAGADSSSNKRSNYKSLTFEHTFLCPLHWMILQMSFRFMHPQTALKLLGEEGVMLFDPNGDYTYQPVTSNIEQEHGKAKKLGIIDQMLGRLVNVPNPKTPMLINKLMSMAFGLLGADYQDFESALLDEGKAGQQAAMGKQGQEQPSSQGMPTDMTSNQNGIPVSSPEEMVRS